MPANWRRPVPRRRLKAGWTVWAFAMVALLGIAVSTVLSSRSLMLADHNFEQVQIDDVVLQSASDFRIALSDLQLYVEPYFAKLSTVATPLDPVELAKGSRLADAEAARVKTLAAALRTQRLPTLATNLERSQTAFTVALTAVAPLIAGVPDNVRARVMNDERGAFTQLWVLSSTISTTVRGIRTADFAATTRHLDNGHATVLIVEAFSAIIVLCTATVVGRRTHRRERTERDKAQRHAFETTLQRALEMSETEAETYVVANRALEAAVPHLQVEMLLADSSHAHFHQAFGTDAGPEARSGCGVVSPLLCPATKRGHTLLFESSRKIDACPYLQGRASGECSAACVAVSIAGKTVGVLHSTAPDTFPPTESDVRYLEVIARQASEQIAMMRAFEKSETQAHSDPLTGLMNRRSLENKVNDLERNAIPYSLAYGDLDHFKVLNDTHGHEAGDQALRLFARVLRDAVRPDDITARYGGEEFVIVLPNCDMETATAILERLRERLALTLANGRVPSFTASFGLAASTSADTFDEIVALADHALLDAKTAGRNRVVRADHQPV